MEIFVTEPFRFAFRGHRVVRINKGLRDVPERCAKAAIRNGWARKKAEMSENKAIKPQENKQYPKKVTDNGWYELSNGERVRGEEKAIRSQKELDE